MSTEVSIVQTDPADPARTEKIGALFELALLVEQHPEIPLPFELSHGLGVNFFSGDHDRDRAELLVAARAVPGEAKKRVWGGDGDTAYFTLDCTVGSIPLTFTAYRNAVCERVVTGTREVTETVPDPEALEAVPTIEVTKTVEDIEWVCAPLNRNRVAS